MLSFRRFKPHILAMAALAVFLFGFAGCSGGGGGGSVEFAISLEDQTGGSVDADGSSTHTVKAVVTYNGEIKGVPSVALRLSQNKSNQGVKFLYGDQDLELKNNFLVLQQPQAGDTFRVTSLCPGDLTVTATLADAVDSATLTFQNSSDGNDTNSAAAIQAVGTPDTVAADGIDEKSATFKVVTCQEGSALPPGSRLRFSRTPQAVSTDNVRFSCPGETSFKTTCTASVDEQSPEVTVVYRFASERTDANLFVPIRGELLDQDGVTTLTEDFDSTFPATKAATPVTALTLKVTPPTDTPLYSLQFKITYPKNKVTFSSGLLSTNISSLGTFAATTPAPFASWDEDEGSVTVGMLSPDSFGAAQDVLRVSFPLIEGVQEVVSADDFTVEDEAVDSLANIVRNVTEKRL